MPVLKCLGTAAVENAYDSYRYQLSDTTRNTVGMTQKFIYFSALLCTVCQKVVRRLDNPRGPRLQILYSFRGGSFK